MFTKQLKTYFFFSTGIDFYFNMFKRLKSSQRTEIAVTTFSGFVSDWTGSLTNWVRFIGH